MPEVRRKIPSGAPSLSPAPGGKGWETTTVSIMGLPGHLAHTYPVSSRTRPLKTGG